VAETSCVSQEKCVPFLVGLGEGSVMLSVKHVARQRCEEFGLRAEVPVEAGLLDLSMSRQRASCEAITPSLVEHLPGPEQHGRAVETLPVLNHSCTLSSITLS